MALIECPNCGKKISDSTVICIHCKFNLKKAKTEEKIKKSFSNIPKNLQKQYEYEFCCSNIKLQIVRHSGFNRRILRADINDQLANRKYLQKEFNRFQVSLGDSPNVFDGFTFIDRVYQLCYIALVAT